MKHWFTDLRSRVILLLICLNALLFVGLVVFNTVQTVKTHSEQKQERERQELQELIDQSMNECKWAYPLDLISRYQCIERLLG